MLQSLIVRPFDEIPRRISSDWRFVNLSYPIMTCIGQIQGNRPTSWTNACSAWACQVTVEPSARVQGTPCLTAWADSGKSGRARRGQALRLIAIRQTRLEQPELSGSSQERMAYGPTATSGGKRIDFSTGIAWFGDILKYREAAPRDRAPFGLSQFGGRCQAVASGGGSAHDLTPLVPAGGGVRRGA